MARPNNLFGARLIGVINLLALISFLYGYFVGHPIFLHFGGSIILIQNLLAIYLGILKPFLPLLLAFIGCSIFTPAITGVYWSVAIFDFLNIPINLQRIFNPWSLYYVEYSEDTKHENRKVDQHEVTINDLPSPITGKIKSHDYEQPLGNGSFFDDYPDN